MSNCWYLNKIRALLGTGTSFHSSKLFCASSATSSNSSLVVSGTLAIISFVAGFNTSTVSFAFDVIHSPLI